MKKVLICGVTGQDGAFLSKFLLERGYAVFGGCRDAQAASIGNLRAVGALDSVQLTSVNLSDFRNVLDTLLRVQPDEVYNLAGQSSVGLSFEQPVETMESIAIGTLNLLEAIRFNGKPIRFYSAGSSECFGGTGDTAADESTPFRPRSPYAVAKAAAFWQVANYREAYRMYACTGILFNHESPLRAARFVTRKIASAAVRIAGGSREKLCLGDLDIRRDWGWAPEYVQAMWLLLQQEVPDDFVIATGETYSLREFVEHAFRNVGLNWEEHVTIDASLYRPTELREGRANPSKAAQQLRWKATISMPGVVERMVSAELEMQGVRLANSRAT